MTGPFHILYSNANIVTTNTIESVDASIKRRCRALSLLQGHPNHHYDILVEIREVVWRFNSRDQKHDLVQLVYVCSLHSLATDIEKMQL